jgi:hypothetical protein
MISERLLIKTFRAAAAIPRHRIVNLGSANDIVQQSTAAGNLHMGVTTELDVVANERVDVVLAGLTQIVAGAAIARGALVTSDASGRAVTAATTNRVIGQALTDAAAAGDLIVVNLSPSLLP